MLLLAESGGSKTDWIFGSSLESARTIQTAGLNPNGKTEQEIRAVLRKKIIPWLGTTPLAIYFFGAGLGNEKNKKLIYDIFQKELPGVERIWIESDLLACAYAALADKPGTIGILGTGSVAFFYNGNRVLNRAGGWGFLLGDEGGGISLGKEWIRLYLSGQISHELQQHYQEHTGLKKDQISEQVYKAPLGDFLAKQTYFLCKYQQEEEVRLFLESQFEIFIRDYLKHCIFQENPRVILMGGVAKNFVPILGNTLEREGIPNWQLFTASPIHPLFNYLLRSGKKSS